MMRKRRQKKKKLLRHKIYTMVVTKSSLHLKNKQRLLSREFSYNRFWQEGKEVSSQQVKNISIVFIKKISNLIPLPHLNHTPCTTKEKPCNTISKIRN